MVAPSNRQQDSAWLTKQGSPMSLPCGQFGVNPSCGGGSHRRGGVAGGWCPGWGRGLDATDRSPVLGSLLSRACSGPCAPFGGARSTHPGGPVGPRCLCPGSSLSARKCATHRVPPASTLSRSGGLPSPPGSGTSLPHSGPPSHFKGSPQDPLWPPALGLGLKVFSDPSDSS